MARLAAESPPSPRTPTRRRTPTNLPNSPISAQSIDRFVRNLAIEFSFPELAPPHGGIEPGQAANQGAKCRKCIHVLFRKDRGALDLCLNNFRCLSTPERALSKLRELLEVQRDHYKRSQVAIRRTPQVARHVDTTSFTTEATSANTSFDSVFSNNATAATSFTTSASQSGLALGSPERRQTDNPANVPLQPPSPSPLPRDRASFPRSHQSPSSRLVNGNIRNFFSTVGSVNEPVAPIPFNARLAQDTGLPHGNTSAKGTLPITSLFGQSKPRLAGQSSNVLQGSDKATNIAAQPQEPATSNKNEPLIHHSDSNQIRTSKSKQEHFQCRDIPDGGFFIHDLPESYHSAPLRLKYECLRHAAFYKIELPQLQHAPSEAHDNLEALYRWLGSLGSNVQTHLEFESLQHAVWESASAGGWTNEISLGGRLNFQASKASSALQLVLNPLRQHKKSNRFFRKFGSNRFLKLIIPKSKSIPEHLKDNKAEFQDRLLEWLEKPKSLWGCSWTAVFMKPSKSTNKSREKFGDDDGREVMFFAEEGPGLTKVTRQELLNWFLPFSRGSNRELPACKAYSRLELGFSSTIPTIEFLPSQVHQVPNIVGDGALEDSALNDSRLDWSGVFHPSKPREMNDGCEMISAAAARIVWTKLGGAGPVPSAFQARIGPWKGVWMVASPPHYGSIAHDDIWIRVNPTQTKFQRHEEDEHDFGYDPLRLSFDVVQWSCRPSSSTFYHEYLPILEDRGISRDVCSHVVREWLKAEKEEARLALMHPVRILEWIQSKRSILSTYAEGTEWCGPKSKTQSMMAQSMIQSGFDVRKCSYLLKLVMSTMTTYHTGISNDLRIGIPLSTSLIGVADPIGVLHPNEISLVFSDPKIAGMPILSNVDALVSRHPALRRSDVQRVHVVCRSELTHLVDVVVFPTTGTFPLAGKLQGGDYDGDTFWVCWDPKLVEGFRNAPPPAEPPSPQNYNISVDRRKCGDFLRSSAFDAHFLRMNFEFQLQEDLLGRCTNYHKCYRYNVQRMNNPDLDKLADIHDLLVDSSKNGYRYSAVAWHKWRLRNARLECVLEPIFDQAHDIKLDDDSIRARRCKINDITDYLVFDVARVETRKMLSELANFANKDTLTQDADVSRLYEIIHERFSDTTQVIDVMRDLQSRLTFDSHFYEPWRKAIARVNYQDCGPSSTDDIKKKSWASARQECRKRFRDIEPCLPHHPSARGWLIKFAIHAPSQWDLIKASALFKQWHNKPDFAFAIAGELICHMKSYCLRGTESVIAPILQRTKIRKRKVAEVDYEPPEHAYEDVLSDAEEDFVSAVGGDDEPIPDVETEAFVPDAGVTIELAPNQDALQQEPTWSGSTQYDFPDPPTGTPVADQTQSKYDTAPQEQEVDSTLSEDYSQMSMAELV